LANQRRLPTNQRLIHTARSRYREYYRKPFPRQAAEKSSYWTDNSRRMPEAAGRPARATAIERFRGPSIVQWSRLVTTGFKLAAQAVHGEVGFSGWVVGVATW